MVHALAILFFLGVLIAMTALLEHTVRDNLHQIAAALRGPRPARPKAARHAPGVLAAR